MKLRAAYEKSLLREGHVRDPSQLELIASFEALHDVILSNESPRRGVLSWFGHEHTSDRQPVTGLYIWGGVGRGKTFLMDLFFDCLPIKKKRRVHFHRMMQDVHRRLSLLDDIDDPLTIVAAEIASETRVLCFDEFYISDIGDAMIMARLLDGLFRKGVTLVATSNSHPDDLYRDGLQRQQFLPAIDLLKRHTNVINLDGNTDYRLRLLQTAGTYLAPDDQQARRKLDYYFGESASSAIRVQQSLDINGRNIDVRKCAKGIAWFEFEAICDGPRSQADYIEIARWYPNVIVSGVPLLDQLREDQTRRFIALVDEFYDRRVKLIVSAACPPETLYTGTRLRFEFDRTISRLVEMQSSEYLALPHLA